MIALARPKVAERLTKIPLRSNGMGHMTLPDVTAIPVGYSVRTYDVNLDRPGQVSGRRGMAYLAENPAGALTVADFESDETWTGANVSADVVNFREFEAGGAGLRGLRLTNPGGGVTATRSGLALNLGPDTDEFIAFWIYWSDVAEAPSVVITFTTSGSNRFLYQQVSPSSAGWYFYAIRKSAFTISGVPDWTSITSITLSADDALALGGYFVTIDNMYVAPKKVDGLYNFRQSAARGGGTFRLAAARGTVAYLDEAAKRWVPLITGLTAYVPYTFATLNDYCYVMNGVDAVRVITGNGLGMLTPATSYLAGIAPATAVPVLTEMAGGVLPSGVHDYKIVPYSTITGKEGNSVVDANGATKLITITTGANAKVRLSSLPSWGSDAKVTHLRIYRRDSTDAHYRRVSSDLNGEVPAGQDAYEDNTANGDLGAELEGRSDYVLNSPPPVLGFAAVVGNRMVGAGNPAAPGTLYVSRSNTGEQWDLVNASVRMDLNDNDPINGVADAFGFALVGKDRAAYAGSPASVAAGFVFRKVESRAGFMSHRSVVVLEDAVRYRSHDGYYEMRRDWVAKKISRAWDTGPVLPGLIEPTFAEFESSKPSVNDCCGAYNKRRAQIIWTDTRFGNRVPDIAPVLHVGAIEGTIIGALDEEEVGPASGWAFHRFAFGNTLAGLSCVANYIDVPTGKHLVMGGGPGGFVYRLDTDEYDDLLVGGNVAIDSDMIHPPYSIPGVAMGTHVLKDFREDRIVFTPLGNWPVALTYYYDWRSEAGSAQSTTPVGTDLWTASATPFTAGAIEGETGTMVRIVLPARLSRNIARRIRNNTLGQSFEYAESTYHVEYGQTEGAV
jgi:hypothetical protein